MNIPKFVAPDWVTPNIPHWIRWLAEYKDQPVHALTIGCFEGRAERWLLENILTHPRARITCIDPFSNAYYESLIGAPPDGLGNMLNEAYSRFLHNTLPWTDKLVLMRRPSYEALGKLPPVPTFDFSYIDGAHLARIVLEDSVGVWQRLKLNGTLIWDDYRWRAHGNYLPPKIAINAFKAVYAGYWCDLEAVRNQVKIRKIL